ncbi:hypothetical protein [Microtetraspora glauca]|uniref:Uncharacterized protein n=1 Tax=Microtetraspora glauca TaxID=1996 RepID=A0ABV3GJ09_MICGL
MAQHTGAPRVRGYVKNYMLPQMRELIEGYAPDIIWPGWSTTATGGADLPACHPRR